jgi:hypothetical protein
VKRLLHPSPSNPHAKLRAPPVLDAKPDSDGVYTPSRSPGADGALNSEQVAYLHELAEAVFLLPTQRREFEQTYQRLARARGAIPALLMATQSYRVHFAAPGERGEQVMTPRPRRAAGRL